jgi:hypothetical protein
VNCTTPMIVDNPASPNHGVAVLVDLLAPGWNPHTDQPDSDYVHAQMPNGVIGTIERKYLK